MTERHLTWPNLEAIIERGLPARLAIPGRPTLYLLVEAHGSLLALLAPISPDVKIPASTLEEVRLERSEFDGNTYLLLGTATKLLYREFYVFLTSVADLIQLDGNSPLAALEKGLESWRRLLRSVSLLTAEEEIGLVGELWLLERLMLRFGVTALDSWTGPLAETHDFRFGENELEVKSTRRRDRIHVISSLDQLVPSPQRKLFLLSLQFEPADAAGGQSLNRRIAGIRQQLAGDAARLGRFNQFLESVYGYRDADNTHYEQSFQLRSKPSLIPVDEACPKLTRREISSALPQELLHRLLEVRYSINVDGLGYSDGTPEFLSIVPAP